MKVPLAGLAGASFFPLTVPQAEAHRPCSHVSSRHKRAAAEQRLAGMDGAEAAPPPASRRYEGGFEVEPAHVPPVAPAPLVDAAAGPDTGTAVPAVVLPPPPPPPTCLFGQEYVQGRYRMGRAGTASYHFPLAAKHTRGHGHWTAPACAANTSAAELGGFLAALAAYEPGLADLVRTYTEVPEEAGCFISYTSAPGLWATDDGERLPARKPFVNTRYDPAAREFRGDVVWSPVRIGGAALWKYRFVLSEDFGIIESGENTQCVSRRVGRAHSSSPMPTPPARPPAHHAAPADQTLRPDLAGTRTTRGRCPCPVARARLAWTKTSGPRPSLAFPWASRR